jgi:IclR family KDG regulon transcriptional repressor
MVSAVGRRLPAHCTAVGKVLLAGLSREALDARYPPGGSLVVMTPNSISTLSQLRAHLDQVRRDLIAFDDCESNEAVHCVAAPVYDHTGRMAAGISISVPATRWHADRAAALSPLVRSGADDLSRRLGHRGPAPTAAAG